MQKEDKKEVLPTTQDYKGKDVLRVKEFIYRKSSWAKQVILQTTECFMKIGSLRIWGWCILQKEVKLVTPENEDT